MLKDTLFKFLKIDGLIDNLTGYIETRVQLLKIDVKEEVAKLIAKAFLVLVCSFAFVLFIVLLSIAAAYYFSSMVGMAMGFVIVAGFYLLVGLILVLFRKEIGEILEKKLIETTQQKD